MKSACPEHQSQDISAPLQTHIRYRLFFVCFLFRDFEKSFCTVLLLGYAWGRTWTIVTCRGENLSVSSDNKAVAQTNISAQSLKYEYRQGKQSGTTPAGKNYLPPRAGHHGITVMALEELIMADSCIPWLLFSENNFLHD